MSVYEAVLRADQSGEHPDPSAIYQSVRATGAKVALSSVYRALTTLEELGLLRRHQLGDRNIYEPASHLPHSHLVDLSTGVVTDLRDEAIEKQMRERSERSGFELSHYTHTLVVGAADKRSK